MKRTPTTPDVGVEGRRSRVGQYRPSETADKGISGKAVGVSTRAAPPGPIDLEEARERGSGPDHATSALLSDKDVHEYQKLYKARFGKDITFKEAHEQGIKLVRLLELIYTPMTLDEHRRLQQRRKDTGHS